MKALISLISLSTALLFAQGAEKKGKQMPARPPVKSHITICTVADGSHKIIHTVEGFYQAPNWSPDGKYLLLNSPGRLWRLPLADPKLEPVDTGEVRGVNNDHGITNDGKWYAISAGQMFVLPSTGGHPRQLTKTAPSYFHGFSPDGNWLAYCAPRDKNFDIYRIPFAGGEEERLTAHPGYDDGPEYSPDGKWIYFNSNRSGSWDIWRMPATGAGPGDAKAERITSDELEDWFPHVSPDGKTIVFLSFEKGIPGHPANKNVVLRMLPAPGAQAGPPKIREIVKLFGGQGTINVNSWSPDSKQFAYVSYELLPN
ncbi:MAG: transporter [Bryobacteraceae bacterium]